MKYLEILKSHNAFDFTNNNLNIESVLFNKKTKVAYVKAIIANILTPQALDNFRNKNEMILKKAGAAEVILSIEYTNQELNSALAREYFRYIVDGICKEDFMCKSLMDLQVNFENNIYTLSIDSQSSFLETYSERLKKEFLSYYLSVDFKFVVSEELKSLSEIQNIQAINDIEALSNNREEKKEIEEKRKYVKVNKFSRRISVENFSKICQIPATQEEIFTYQENVGLPHFMIEAEIFEISIDKKRNGHVVKAHVFDETDSIIVNKWINDSEVEVCQKLKAGDLVNIIGKAEYNIYQRDVILSASEINYIGAAKKETKVDTSIVKRVELHVHTRMSGLDGLCSADDFMKVASEWGMPAIAFTDHCGVYANSEISHSKFLSKIKPIYGVELPFIDDLDYKVAFDDRSIELRKAKYVVFDLETTGFSQTHDRIIEIAAIKVEGGIITDSYNTFVNPEMFIPQKITELTTITNEDVVNAPKIEQAMQEFLDFSKDAILVAHNASFDVGMIKANMKRLNIKEINFPVIDTLNLFRAAYNIDEEPEKGIKKAFNLKVLAKYFKIKQEQHHRAIDDTKVTAQCFIGMLNDLYKKGIEDYNQINSVINPANFYKYVIPAHINVLSQNETGFRNMYRLLSDALTVHCSGEARLLKSVLNQYREGLFVLSGCYKGRVFETALNRSYEEMIEEMKYCDFIEVQPPSSYMHLVSDYDNALERIESTIKKIIDGAKSLNKLVVATSDAHYIFEEDKKYRDILIASPQIGGGTHDLFRAEVAPDAHLRTTDDMLREFDFLGKSLSYEIVVTNTNEVANQIDTIEVFKREMFAPRDDEFKESLGIDSIEVEMRRIVAENMEKTYGLENVHPLIQARLDREVNAIISNGFSSTYYMSHLLVKESMKHGYMVGSRGSVGSSIAATMMNITEINPLPPHYLCKKCKFVALKMTDEEKKQYGVKPLEEQFQKDLAEVESGYDLPDAVCPVCGEPMKKDGHDIPFETFLGFKGNKVPDIDLNFSGEFQAQAHAYIKEIFGETHAFRAGTLSQIKDKNAIGYVKGYLERKNIQMRKCEVDRISRKIIGVKRSTGQHPGGIVVVPKHSDIFQVTPVQYPADNTDNAWITTHYDYHAFESNLLKLDCLGHDDPTLIRYFMDYVDQHPEKYPFKDATEIPVDDKNVYKMFYGTEVCNVTEEQIMSKVASYAVPEFGTNFVRQMLNDTMPKTFAQLVKISGLSHGTNVWLTNAQDLVLGKTEFGAIPFKDIVGCRDDIMINLIAIGCEPYKAFEIMEFVRKGNAKRLPDVWQAHMQYMRDHNVPEWYIWTCDRIEYLFPKAHATAYVLMALRIAWFKLYSPALFYSGWFTKRAKAWDVNSFVKGEEFIRQQIKYLSEQPGKTAKEEDVITSLLVALEMTSRGVKFLPIDIKESDSLVFKVVDDNTIRIPFVAVDGLGESAAESIKKARDEKPFTSKADVLKRSKLNKTLFDLFDQMGAFGDLPDEDPEVEVGLFAFLN